MDKQDRKIKQMPPFNMKPGIHVEKLAVSEMQSIWHTIITMTNQQFKERCVQNCDGCKQLSNPHPCEIARVRYGMLDYAATTPYGRFQQAVIDDLKEAMFRYAPFYENPA